MLVENPTGSFAGVVQMQRNIFQPVNDVLDLDLYTISSERVRSVQDRRHATSFA